MNDDCDICKIIPNKEEFNLIYEDEICLAILHESPSNEGHVLVIPKKHYTIIEEVDDKDLEHIFLVANKISMSVFETLGAHGTNILINNGPNAGQTHSHFMINVIPRYENDEINFDWDMKQADQNELDQTLELLISKSDSIFFGNESNSNNNKDPTKKIDKIDNEKHSYQIDQLKRIP